MKIVIQRVRSAEVTAHPDKRSGISEGMLLLVGVERGDGPEKAEKLASKIAALRIFDDDAGKMNLDISDKGGSLLSVPQFTLLGSL